MKYTAYIQSYHVLQKVKTSDLSIGFGFLALKQLLIKMSGDG